MGITARDLFFVLRVRDEASSVLNGVSRDILRVGAAAQASSARAQAAALRQQADNIKAMAAQKIEADAVAAANLRAQAQQLRATGATKQQTAQLYAQARAYDQHAATIQRDADKQVAQLKKAASAWDNEAKSLEASYRKHQQMSQTLRDTSTLLTIVGLALTGVGVAGAAGLLSMVKAAQEYNRTVALTKTQVDGFSASLSQLSAVGIKTAVNVAAPFEQMQSTLYDIFSSTNANLQQGTVLLDGFARAAVAGQVNIQDASRSTMAIMNAFKIPFENVNKVLDLQFQLVRKGVGTYAEFSSVIGRAVPSAVRAGQSLQTLDAMLVFLTRNGLSAAMAASSAGRALDAMSNPKAVAAMEALGITVKDLKGNFLPLVDVLGQLSQKIGSLPDAARSKAISDIFKGAGGTIQALRFLNQVIKPDQYKAFVGFLGDMSNSTGQFAQAYNTMANTTAAKTQLLKNNWEALKVTVGNILMPVFNGLIGVIGLLMQKFNNLSDSTKKYIVQGAFIATVVTIATGLFLLLLGAVGMVASGLAALGLSLGTVAGILAIVAAGAILLGVAFYQAYKSAGSFRDLITSIGTSLSAAWNQLIKPTVEGLKNAFDKDLRPALEHLWNVIQLNVIPIFTDMVNLWRTKLLPAAKELWNWLKTVADKGFKYISDAINNWLIPALNKATEFYYKHKTGIDQIVAGLTTAAKWFAKVAGSAVLGALVVAIIAVIGIIAALIVAWVKLISIIGDVIHWVSEAINWFRRWFSDQAPKNWAHMIQGAVGDVINTIGALPGRIASVMGSMGSLLWNAGRNLIQGLINGIKSEIGSLMSTLGGITSLIPNLKGPPAKDRKLLYNSGQLIMEGLSAGISSVVPQLTDKLAAITKQVSVSAQASIQVGRPVVAPTNTAPAARNVTNYITINTPKLTPRVQAEQLGILLGGRVG